MVNVESKHYRIYQQLSLVCVWNGNQKALVQFLGEALFLTRFISVTETGGSVHGSRHPHRCNLFTDFNNGVVNMFHTRVSCRKGTLYIVSFY